MVRKRWTVRMLSYRSVYVAVETNCTERAHISRAWIREVAEPFRTGHGWRLRLGHFAVQCGSCEEHPEIEQDVEAFREHMFMRWLPYRHGAHADAPDQGRDQGAGEHEVRPDESVDVRRDGVVEPGDVQGLQPLRVGPGPDDAGVEDDGPSGPVGDEAEAPVDPRLDVSVYGSARSIWLSRQEALKAPTCPECGTANRDDLGQFPCDDGPNAWHFYRPATDQASA